MGQKKSSRTRNRPRRWGGRYSASSDGSTTSMPPSPMPARKRSANSDVGPQASAVRAVKRLYQKMEAWKIRLRPVWSASRPSRRLPTSDPASAEAPIQPSQVADRFQIDPNSGSVNPISRISMATNVQAMPVMATALRWKGVKPAARRTASTSRRRVSEGGSAGMSRIRSVSMWAASGICQRSSSLRL
jgi:hypothetical protein